MALGEVQVEIIQKGPGLGEEAAFLFPHKDSALQLSERQREQCPSLCSAAIPLPHHITCTHPYSPAAECASPPLCNRVGTDTRKSTRWREEECAAQEPVWAQCQHHLLPGFLHAPHLCFLVPCISLFPGCSPANSWGELGVGNGYNQLSCWKRRARCCHLHSASRTQQMKSSRALGMPYQETCCHPSTDGSFLFSGSLRRGLLHP